MHGDVLDQLLEALGARHEVGLAVDLDQDADLAAGVDVGADHALGFTHEEVFALIASELSSYRDLPQIWYQVQTKFRDEPRPKSGLLRVREFTMKDSYSLDLDWAGLDRAFDLHHGAYKRIFERLGMKPVDVDASVGMMGGTGSVEFVVPSLAGEDWIITCPKCDYRANLGRGILIGLELLIAADILKSVVIDPTIDSMLVLGGIVVIRTFLSISLDVEINGHWPWETTRLSSASEEAPRPDGAR